MPMKRLPVVLAAVLLIFTALPLSVSARDLEDYYIDKDYQTFDDRYEEYYKNGIMQDETGVIHVNGGSESMKVGETRNLAAQRIYHNLNEDLDIGVVTAKEWASKDPGIVSVDFRGVVTAHKIGSARITVSYTDNRGYKSTQTIHITVHSAGASGSVAAAEKTNYFEIAEGKRIYLGGLLPSGFSEGNTQWATSKEKIASVDGNGLVMADSIGGCTITATRVGEDGAQQTATFSIRVTSGLLGNNSNDIRIVIPVGKELDVIKMFYPNYISLSSVLKNIQCTTSDSNVVWLQGREVRARQKGSCTVTINYQDGWEIAESQRVNISVTG